MIKLIKPYISFEEVQNEFKEVFDSGWFTKGKFVEEFREEIKKLYRCKALLSCNFCYNCSYNGT